MAKKSIFEKVPWWGWVAVLGGVWLMRAKLFSGSMPTGAVATKPGVKPTAKKPVVTFSTYGPNAK